MQPVNLVYQIGRLAPASGADHEILDREMGDGEIITTELRPVQGPGQKQFWALINAAYKSSTAISNRWDTPEDFADAVKIACKHRSAGQTIGGMPYFVGLSLAAVKDWEFFNMAVKSCLITKLGVPEALLEPPVEQDPNPGAGQEGREDLQQQSDADTFPGDTQPRQEDPDSAKDVKPKKAPAAKRKAQEQVVPVALCRECAEKMLAFAEDLSTFGDNTSGQLKTLNVITSDWKDTIPEYGNFVDTIAETCQRIIASAPSDHDKRSKLHNYVLSLVPIEEKKP